MKIVQGFQEHFLLLLDANFSGLEMYTGSSNGDDIEKRFHTVGNQSFPRWQAIPQVGDHLSRWETIPHGGSSRGGKTFRGVAFDNPTLVKLLWMGDRNLGKYEIIK